MSYCSAILLASELRSVEVGKVEVKSRIQHSCTEVKIKGQKINMENQIGIKGKKPKEKGKKTITPIRHISHVKKVEDLFDQLPKEDKKYRCPLCRLDKYKPTWPSKVKKHLQSHDHRIQIKVRI
ncbi:uncharacterized protein [Ptychodera flava]|uniref:uncharacterized protein n=1 Tax=Ptychodera flava TaxID=63121 RepID=UPI003969F314